MADQDIFQKLYSMDVSSHMEKKGRFSYLSWPYAVAELRKVDPSATWEVCRFDGKPFMVNECGYFVEVAVTVQDVTLSQIHPILDNNNKPIAKPSSFQVNTSIMRCLVKAIALHGLGLYIYAGEDLPETPKEEPKTATVISNELKVCKTLAELGKAWKDNLPHRAKLLDTEKQLLDAMKEELKIKLTTAPVSNQ